MLLLLACTQKTPPEVPVAEPAPAPELPAMTAEYPSVLFLDGQYVLASWDDGDTFKSPRPDDEPLKARLAGYNTLESYGPVHRWGDWDPAELYLLSKEAADVASSEAWTCDDTGKGGGYGRALVDCPDLRRALLERGLAHSFVMNGEPLPDDLAAQQEAIRTGAGMWARGAPTWLTTSVHSLDEREGQIQTYNRVVNTQDGSVERRMHEETFASCTEVCPTDSCMIYVPYERRYGDNKAACLR